MKDHTTLICMCGGGCFTKMVLEPGLELTRRPGLSNVLLLFSLAPCSTYVCRFRSGTFKVVLFDETTKLCI